MAIKIVFLTVTAMFIVTMEQGASAQQNPDYIGETLCKACHPTQAQSYALTPHSKLSRDPRDETQALGCEMCHGPGRAHFTAGGGRGVGGIISFRPDGPETGEKQNEACLKCHQKGSKLFWAAGAHQERGLRCVSCHTLMKKVSVANQLKKPEVMEVCFQCHTLQKAQLYRSSHMPIREKKVTCTDCHNPHGTLTDKLLKANSVNELCYTCHAELRGPFLWEHPPARENCLYCHNPHGSIYRKLLVINPPRLCQNCHIETEHNTDPQGLDSRFLLNRSCLNCHSRVHGSNHPSGVRFHR